MTADHTHALDQVNVVSRVKPGGRGRVGANQKPTAALPAVRGYIFAVRAVATAMAFQISAGVMPGSHGSSPSLTR